MGCPCRDGQHPCGDSAPVMTAEEVNRIFRPGAPANFKGPMPLLWRSTPAKPGLAAKVPCTRQKMGGLGVLWLPALRSVCDGQLLLVVFVQFCRALKLACTVSQSAI